MQLKDLRAFLVTASTQNLRAAAELLGVSQPAVSKAIHRIEAALGGPVFERTARGVALTRIGEVLLRRGQALEGVVEDIHAEIGDIRAGNSGLVRLGTVPLMLEPVVVPTLSRLVGDAAPLRFDVQVHLSAELLRALQAGRLDIAIAAMPSDLAPDLTYVSLGTRRSFVVASASHPILGQPFTLADLAAEKWLLPPPDLTLHQWIAGVFHAEGLQLPAFTVQSDASASMFAALVQGTALLAVMAEEQLLGASGADSGLRALPPPAPQREVQMGLFWRRNAFFSQPMQRCRAEARAAFGAWKARVDASLQTQR